MRENIHYTASHQWFSTYPNKFMARKQRPDKQV